MGGVAEAAESATPLLFPGHGALTDPAEKRAKSID